MRITVPAGWPGWRARGARDRVARQALDLGGAPIAGAAEFDLSEQAQAIALRKRPAVTSASGAWSVGIFRSYPVMWGASMVSGGQPLLEIDP
jgi:hypothetical protein